ncbi:disulfide bond formation protein B [archaeon]|jgi:disulfide bond formation protein DsbB|nr:disulfide bond formation protein B [archaeon]MBT4352860.1 disulfide bond formation protein B [archaeon]MBT4648648.1 disulfide bond formation protein B [archaeon]MBT6821826.1 disulfide bond formation protein B [archaeon]MBT7392236.1 disulfide bond formation protein B [archaeon]
MTNINWQITGIFFTIITLFGITVIIFLLYQIFLNKFLKGKFKIKKDNAILYSFLIALTGLLGSLFFSEIAKYDPCNLCWYQRIFMYPLVIIFFIAYKNKYSKIFRYTIPLTIIGGTIAIFQYLLQMAPSIFSNSTLCSTGSCSQFFIIEMGFITIPFMSLIAFIGITLISFISLKKNK